MGRLAVAVAILLALLLSGCLGGPTLFLNDALAQSDAAHDGLKYDVELRGRLANVGGDEARWVRVLAAVGQDCLAEPGDWPGFVDVGNLAPGASAPVRATFEQYAPLYPQPALWWRITHTDRSVQAGKGCGALAVG